MNPAVYGSLPSSACTLGTAGSYGNDRITQTVYDAASEPTQFKEAVGTSDAATERTLTYSNNGQLATLLDGESNLTTYEYDGFDRLTKTRYPSTTKGSGTSSTTDYEQLSYDANGNVTSHRLRDGNSIGFTYDNLNRVTFKDLPGSEPDVAYTYDLLGRQLTAKFSGSGLGITNGYDALSRLTSSTSNVDGTARTMSSQYDAAGDRTMLTGNIAGYSATFNYDVLGRMTAYVGEVGIGYDNLGHRTSMSMGTSGSSTVAYGYDGVDRLTSLTHDLAGTSADQAFTFGYNPASQIASRTSSNDSYAFTGHADANVTTTTNGLNQATAVGSASLTYDARGNLTSDGSNTYVYDSENRLTSVSGAHTATLSYDPLGRLWQVVSPSGTTRFVYDGAHDVVETDGSGNVLRSFVWGPGADEPLVWWEGAGPKMLHADERGSIVAVADGSGNLIGINKYDEYGVPASTNVGRFQYTGQMRLNEVGIYNYKARNLLAELPTFLEPDPIGYADSANAYDPMGGDPVNFTDPTGLCIGGGGSVEDDGKGGAVVTCPWITGDVAALLFGGREDSSSGSRRGLFDILTDPGPLGPIDFDPGDRYKTCPAGTSANTKGRPDYSGIATMYGQNQNGTPDQFANHETANGEIMDPNAMTAASVRPRDPNGVVQRRPLIPMGTVLVVSLISNPSRSVTVRINDTGPLRPGRILDLSTAAMKALTGKAYNEVPVNAFVCHGGK